MEEKDRRTMASIADGVVKVVDVLYCCKAILIGQYGVPLVIVVVVSWVVIFRVIVRVVMRVVMRVVVTFVVSG
jgi:fatty-acid desaturase